MLRKSLPLQLLLCLVLVGVGGSLVPLPWVRALYTVSCLFKDLLLTFLPLVVFSCLAGAMVSLDKRAPLLLGAILVLVTLSNACMLFVSYGVARSVLPLLHIHSAPPPLQSILLLPAFALPLPHLRTDHAMLLGGAWGLVCNLLERPRWIDGTLRLQRAVTQGLVHGFVPLLPLYVLGFSLKMQREGGLAFVAEHYLTVFALICALLLVYLSVMYLAGSGFRMHQAGTAVRTMLPAGLLGFSTMSSAVAMPVTLLSTQKNLQDPPYAKLVIPTTLSIHMTGDGLGLMLLVFGIMSLLGEPTPSLAVFAAFVPSYCLAKFSVAAIPGGSILVLLPLLQSHFGLSAGASSLITTLYILQDPMFAFANVMGNGAFALWSHALLRGLRLAPPPSTNIP